MRPDTSALLTVALAAALGLSAGCARPAADDGAVCRAYREGRSGVEVTASGTVRRVLGLRSGPHGTHEGFLLRLDHDCALTVRVESNVGFTGTIPLRRGDPVIVRGEFDDDGGDAVIHWTHRSFGRHPSGYVIVRGRLYE
jgi:hypothetical protein